MVSAKKNAARIVSHLAFEYGSELARDRGVQDALAAASQILKDVQGAEKALAEISNTLWILQNGEPKPAGKYY